jgi:hypothetical protein
MPSLLGEGARIGTSSWEQPASSYERGASECGSSMRPPGKGGRKSLKSMFECLREHPEVNYIIVEKTDRLPIINSPADDGRSGGPHQQLPVHIVRAKWALLLPNQLKRQRSWRS